MIDPTRTVMKNKKEIENRLEKLEKVIQTPEQKREELENIYSFLLEIELRTNPGPDGDLEETKKRFLEEHGTLEDFIMKEMKGQTRRY